MEDAMKQTDTGQKIKELLKSQKFAVLATHNDGQPYCNLVAFAETGDCKTIIFATNRNTSKYRNLTKDHRVSVLVDNRTNRVSDLEDAVALDLMGIAIEISQDTFHYYKELYTSKHPALVDFVNMAENSLFRVNIQDYIIASFGSVVKVPVSEFD
jgi:heme iron utilization protein